jgi:hypothetical protein
MLALSRQFKLMIITNFWIVDRSLLQLDCHIWSFSWGPPSMTHVAERSVEINTIQFGFEGYPTNISNKHD